MNADVVARSMRSLHAIIVCSLLVTTFGTVRPARAATDRPAGLPEAAVAAKVTGYNDGDKFEAIVDGKEVEVLLISADAPESGECFAQESADYLETMLPKDSTVYLEKDTTDTDKKGRPMRYAWTNVKG